MTEMPFRKLKKTPSVIVSSENQAMKAVTIPQNDILSNDYEKCLTELKALLEKKAEKDSLLFELKQKSKKNMSLSRETLNRIDALDIEILSLKKKISICQRNIKENNKQFNKLRIQNIFTFDSIRLAFVGSKVRKEKAKLETKTEKLSELQKKKTELEKEMDLVEKAAEELSLQKEEFLKQKEAVTEQHLEKTKALEQLKLNETQSLADYQKLLSETETIINELSERKTELANGKSELENERKLFNKETQEKLNAIDIEITSVKSAIREKEQLLNNKRTELSDLETSLKSHSSEHDKLVDEKTALAKEKEKADREILLKTNELNDLHKNLSKVESSIYDMYEKINESKQIQHNSEKNLIKESKDFEKEKISQNKRINLEFEKIDQEILSQKKILEEKNNELSGLKTALESALIEQTKIDEQFLSLKKEKEEFTASTIEITTAKEEKQKQLNELTQKLLAFEEEYKALVFKLNEADKQASDCKALL